MLCLFHAFSSSMNRFDNGPEQASALEGITSNQFVVLSTPMFQFWKSWGSKVLPDFAEFLLFGGNSILWGFILTLVLKNVKKAI